MSNGKASRAEIAGFCLYDFANSAYATIIISIAFAVYYVTQVASGSKTAYGVAYALSEGLVVLAAPLLGAVVDHVGKKKRFLFAAALVSIVATAGLWLVTPGPQGVRLGFIFFVISNVGFALSFNFYNAILPDLATSENTGRISGYGWAAGYLGGLLSIAICYPLLRNGPEDHAGFRLAFVVTAAFYLVFTIVSVALLKDRRARPGRLRLADLRAGYDRLRETAGHVRRYRELWKFLLAFFFFNDGITTVILYATLFAFQELHMTMAELCVFFMLFQLPAFAGALIFGRVSDRVGQKPALRVTLVIWIVVVVGCYLTHSKAMFYALGMVAGLAIGSNQAISRALVALLSPRARASEFFGFFAVCAKLTAILGPVVYGVLADATGNQRAAVLSIAAFFVVGLLLLEWVDERAGIAAAREEEKAEGPA